MNALVLGGMSPRHREWVRQVADALRPQFAEVRFLDYWHWGQPDTKMDLEYEITQAAKLAEGLGAYVVVAKSIGTVVTTLANARGGLAPKRCVFMGFPLKTIDNLPQAGELAAALRQLPPTVFAHNENDPLGTAEALRAYVAANAPAHYECLVTPGDTHDYTDFVGMARLASKG